MVVSITTDFIRKIFECWDAVECTVADAGFLKVGIFTWKPEFYHWQQTASVVFLAVTGSLHSFWRTCLPNTCLWNHSWSVLPSSKNGVPLKKKKKPLAVLHCKPSIVQELCLQTTTSVCRRSVYVYFLSHSKGDIFQCLYVCFHAAHGGDDQINFDYQWLPSSLCSTAWIHGILGFVTITFASSEQMPD